VNQLLANAIRVVRALRRPSKATNARRLQRRGESVDSFVIREASLDDVPSLARVHVVAWNATHGGWGSTPSYDLRLQQWTRKFESGAPGWFCFLAQDAAGSVVGFVTGQSYSEPVPAGFAGQLAKIYLLADRQRLGLGRRLMGHAARRFLERGISSMLLFSQPENPSCAFFEALGGERLFSESDEFHGAYGWRNLAVLAAACPVESN
jgi:ribosomal protein S18 acetylase RimI-like enzyme